LNLQLAQNQELCNMPSMKKRRHRQRNDPSYKDWSAYVCRVNEPILAVAHTHSNLDHLDQHTKTLYTLTLDENAKGGDTDNVKHIIPVHQHVST
jgi:hypothetical protein